MSEWIEKQSKAKQLVEEVKAANAEGIDDAEKAQECHKKMAVVQTLMAEVKQEKLIEEKSKLVDLLSQYEAQEPTASNTPDDYRGNGAQLTASTKSFRGDHDHGGTRLVITRKAANTLEISAKALSSATGAAGGFLVPPSYMQNLFAETRRQGNALRRYGWLAEHPVDTNQVLLPLGSGAASVGIVAENATKPSADQTYGQVTVNVFTWAGISKLSNQLIQDSSPTATDLASRELGSLLGNLEEQKIISGTGTGEPRGILNTTGINSVTNGTNTAQATIDAILDAVVLIQTNYFAAPTGILMHPRRLAALQKGKDTATNYLFNPSGSFRAPGGLGASEGGATSVSTGAVAAMPSLFGLPIGISTNVPTNLGAGTNQDIIVVGNFNEAHWFSRQDVTLDVSDTAGTAFESNQTWFRLEERAGFSAERYPKAFATVGGAGLVP